MTTQFNDIQDVLFNLGELSKDDILSMWGLAEEEYEDLKTAFARNRLIEPGPRRKGGFVVKVRRRPKAAPDEIASEVLLQNDWENATVTRLAELFSHAELEKLLGELVYTVRRARTQLTGADRRGTKTELSRRSSPRPLSSQSSWPVFLPPTHHPTSNILRGVSILHRCRIFRLKSTKPC